MKNEKKFSGVIEKGRGLGGKFVVPTINMAVDPGVEFGVYLCRVKVGKSLYFGLMSYGPRPTFNILRSNVEIFLLDFRENLYGQKVEVTVYNKLREIMKFKSAALLREQIEKDVLTARQLIKNFYD